MVEVSRLIKRRDISPVDLVEATLARIGRLDPTLNSFVQVLDENARARAKIAEKEIADGRYRGPLHGIPVSLKDIIYLHGVPNTASSRSLIGFVPDFDATLVARLTAAGAIIVGKTRLWELAMRSEDEPLGGPVRNPWSIEHSAMGSSSGSCAGVAAGLSFASVGTDTGGSIRGPAAACGVVGFKPSYGLVSRHGVTPVSWTLDHVGPIARNVRDCALMMSIIAGYDSRDQTSVDAGIDYIAPLGEDIRNVRIGVVRHLLDSNMDAGYLGAVLAAVAVLEKAGCIVDSIDIPMIEEAQVAMSVINTVESAEVHRDRWQRDPMLFGKNNRERIQIGQMIPAVDYVRALRVRTAFQERLLAAAKNVDVVVLPTSPKPPPRVDAPTAWTAGRKSAMNANNRFRWPFNLSGWPAISIPCGIAEGLPIGLQIAGKPFTDALVLKVAAAYESLTDWHELKPPLAA